MFKKTSLFNRQVLIRRRVEKKLYGVRRCKHSIALDTGYTTRYIYSPDKSMSFGQSVRGVFRVAS